MKEYFLKWLPVGEEIDAYEINVDEKFYDHNSGICTRLAGGIFEYDNKHTCQFPLAEKVNKVKLFLCGDVEIGDTDFYSEPSAIQSYNRGLRFELISIEDYVGGYRSANIKYIQNPTTPSSVGKIRDWPYDNLWKKIGEISLDAEGVEAGDKFTEDQVGWAIHEPWEPTHHVDYETWVRNEHGFHKTIELQCTKCKHFH